MPQVRRSSPAKRLLVPGLCVLAILLLGAGGYWWTHRQVGDGVKKLPTQEQQADTAAKKQFIESSGKTNNSQNTSTSTTDADSSHQIVLDARQDKTDTVTVTTKLYGYSDGTCLLTVTNGSQKTTQTADVIYEPEFSTCAGFSVPVSSLGRGSWTITVSVTTNGASKSQTTALEVD